MSRAARRTSAVTASCTSGGSRFTYEHTGFTGVGGFVMAKLVLGPVRRKMLSVGLPAMLDDLADDGARRV